MSSCNRIHTSTRTPDFLGSLGCATAMPAPSLLNADRLLSFRWSRKWNVPLGKSNSAFARKSASVNRFAYWCHCFSHGRFFFVSNRFSLSASILLRTFSLTRPASCVLRISFAPTLRSSQIDLVKVGPWTGNDASLTADFYCRSANAPERVFAAINSLTSVFYLWSITTAASAGANAKDPSSPISVDAR